MEGRPPLFDLKIDHQGREEFKELGRWMKVQALSVLCMVFLITFTFLFAWGRIGLLFSTNFAGEQAQKVMLVTAVVMLVGAFIVGLMMYFLIRSSFRIRWGIRRRDNRIFNKGLEDLRTYFAFFAVIGIILLFFKIAAWL